MKELSLNILDILENSVHAGATRIHLLLQEFLEKKDFLGFTIVDNGKGMDQAMVDSLFDPFTTTSSTKTVGLGLPLLKQEAEMCDGGAQIQSKPGIGTTVSFWFQHTHIDRPPLGDIVSTVLMMYAVHSDIEFIFTHEVEDRTFEVSTTDLKEVFQDVPINNPTILQGIESFLLENKKQLYGGKQYG
jgi:hypothetical protein